MTVTSAICGTSESTEVPSHSRHAAISFKAEFFAPSTRTSP